MSCNVKLIKNRTILDLFELIHLHHCITFKKYPKVCQWSTISRWDDTKPRTIFNVRDSHPESNGCTPAAPQISGRVIQASSKTPRSTPLLSSVVKGHGIIYLVRYQKPISTQIVDINLFSVRLTLSINEKDLTYRTI